MSTVAPRTRDESQDLQKEMIARWFADLSRAKAEGRKVVYTFVPGNLTELIRSFDCLPVLPEINALQSGMRQRTGAYITEAEKSGHSEDVCTYVKADLGMLRKGNIGPTGEPLPAPDLLLLSYTGCYTFMKWFELLREEYNCPVVMLHVPYQEDGHMTEAHRDYVVAQLKEKVIPALEQLSGKAYDEERLAGMLAKSAAMEDDLVAVFQSAKHHPSPIDAWFGGVYTIGPIFTAFRGTDEGAAYYKAARAEVERRVRERKGPVTPRGELNEQKFRVVVEGPPNWTSFREFWEMFADEGAVCVASTYTKVGGTYDFGWRHDPSRPLHTLAEYCSECYTNRNLPTRIDMLCRYVEDYDADGFLINSVKSCNSFSAGQLLILREVERRTGRPGGFIESDLVDPRYFSAANIKNRLESYFQMLAARRAAAASLKPAEASP
jgi:benzoyl-CoA reductase subunit B